MTKKDYAVNVFLSLVQSVIFYSILNNFFVLKKTCLHKLTLLKWLISRNKFIYKLRLLIKQFF